MRSAAVNSAAIESRTRSTPPRGSSLRELIALDDALSTLAKVDPRKAQIVELRFFGGLSVEETAEVVKVSCDTVMRDWKLCSGLFADRASRTRAELLGGDKSGQDARCRERASYLRTRDFIARSIVAM